MSLLKEIAPHLRAEWDIKKNSENKVYFDTITSTSAKRVWWYCKKNPRHQWQTIVRDRANGRGCPYCFGLSVLPEDSIAYLFPSLCSEFDWEKNPGIDPSAIPPGSKKIVWWKCSTDASHAWKRAVKIRTKSSDQGCPHCRDLSLSLARLAPKIAAEWHTSNNLPRTPQTVRANSQTKAWWRCSKNPEHEWECQIRSRVALKSNCPVCQRSKDLESLPVLTEYDPILAQQWHPEKNGALSPSQFTAGSAHKVWWRCTTEPTHEWESAIRNRARLGRGCPFCASRTALVGHGKSLETKFPLLADQWHSEKNEDLKPSQFLPGSAVRVWWRCSGVPAHEWESTIYNRTSKQPNGECPFCRKTRLSDANSLAIVHPEVAAEWHPTLNGTLSPSDVTRASGKRVWWQCSKNPEHKWDTKIRARTIHKSGCPQCDIENRPVRMQQAQMEAAHSNLCSAKTFSKQLRAVRELLKQFKPSSAHVGQSFFRMTYASIITALETYLADTFYRLVFSNAELTEKLLTTTPEFQEKKYSVAEVLDWQKNIHKRLSDYLDGIAWHNLFKIRLMYESVLSVKFTGEFADLCRAVAIRHDIVHRNGRTKDHRVHRLTDRMLLDLVLLAESFVRKIEDQIQNDRPPDFPGKSSSK